MGFLRLRRNRSPSPAPRELQISDPISKPFDYGPNGPPPWMNDYNVHMTEAMEQRHAARRGDYHSKHEFVPPSFATSRSCSTSSVDIKLVTPSHNPNLPPPLLQIPAGMASTSDLSSYSEVPKTPVKKRRLGLFTRNRGVDDRGRLRDEWEEIYDADWGCPEEYSRNGRRWYE